MNKIEQLLIQSALKVANLEKTETKKRKLGDEDAPAILDDKHGAKKKKKKNKEKREESEHEASASNTIPDQFLDVKLDVFSGDASDMIIKRKKKKKKNGLSAPVLVEKTNLLEPSMVSVKEEIYDNVIEETESESTERREKRRKKLREYVKGDKSVVVAVKDVFKDVNIVKANSSGQISAAVSWILKQDIPVSKLNAKFRRNQIYHKKTARKLKAYGCSRRRFFTDAEDDEILQRVFHLQTKKVISSVQDLCAELNEQENRKNVRRLIGLYLCASLPNRLAYYCTERLLHLVNKMTPAKQRKESGGGRMTWTAAEDILLSESVLFDSRSNSYTRVEMVNEKTVDWEGIYKKFAEKGVASRQVVRERWTRVLKVRLLEGEQDAESTWRHRKSLLEHVANLGVADRREIRWAEVADHFRPVTAAALNQDFWNLIRHSICDERSFQESLLHAAMKLEKRHLKNKGAKFIEKKEENKSELMDWYRKLKFH